MVSRLGFTIILGIILLTTFTVPLSAEPYSTNTLVLEDGEVSQKPPPEPEENDSLPILSLESNSVERGDTFNATFGMQNQSNPEQFIGGYPYSLILEGPIEPHYLFNGTTVPKLVSLKVETYDPDDFNHFPAGNYTVRFVVNSTNRGLMEVNRTISITINPDAKVRFIMAQVNRIGFAVNRSENIILFMENIGSANAFDIRINIQKIEPPIGLEQSVFPFRLPILKPNRSEPVYFRLEPDRFGIGTLELQTEYKNSEGVAVNGIISMDVEVLPKIQTDLKISSDINVENISKVVVTLQNLEKTPVLIRNQLESDKIIFPPNNFDETTLEDSMEIEFLGSVYDKGRAFITYTLFFIDSDGEGEAVLVKESHSIFISDSSIEVPSEGGDLTTTFLIILLTSILAGIVVIIVLLLKPQLKNMILRKLLPTKINRSLDYPTDKIIVDGSNVAWDEPTPDGRANVDNLIIAINELENAGFKDIRVIVDAALRYQVKDTKKFDQLSKKGTFKVLPAKVSGDLFILRLSQQTGALILTNDLFKEFRERFKWIDTRRVPFSVMSGQFFLHPIASEYDN